MNFIFGKALPSLLFYTDNPYFFTTFSKFFSLLFPYFSVDGHLKACVADHIFCSKSMNYVNECKYGAAHKISVLIACAQMSNKSPY